MTQTDNTTSIKPKVSLKALMTPSKTVSIEFPRFEGMTVDLCYLAREELVKLRKRCLSTKWDKKSHQPIEDFDDEKFIIEYCKAVVKGWKGLKYSYLEELLLVDITDLDPEDTLPYNQENAELLMKNATDFDSWVTDTVGDLENFTKNK
jgi:hypothetical protein|tara:strand:- start:2663 stop:3109 length:447 start_codon:yes stop_codon:yes gene_type:complete